MGSNDLKSVYSSMVIINLKTSVFGYKSHIVRVYLAVTTIFRLSHPPETEAILQALRHSIPYELELQYLF